MKNYKLLSIFFVLSFFVQYLYSQNHIDIPSALLKQKLASANDTNNQIAFNSAGDAIVIDTNGDGEIQQGEVGLVYRLNLRHVSGNRITSIVGLESFRGLTWLDIHGHNISDPTELYALSTTLNYLDIGFNYPLGDEVLNFTGTNLSNLETLKAISIGFSTMNIVGLASLKELDVSYNFLTNLNITGCTGLQIINAHNNLFTSSPLATGIASITYGTGDANNVTTLNVNTNDLSNLNLSDFPNLESLNISNNNFTSLDVSGLYNLNFLVCDNNDISNINFGTIDQLSYLACGHNSITELDISNLSNLQTLYCNNNQLTTLDASNNSQLSQLGCGNNNLISMNLKNNGPLLDGEGFYFGGNPNLNYICEDADQIFLINNSLDNYGYTGVTVDSNCNTTTCQIEADFDYGQITFADPCLYGFKDESIGSSVAGINEWEWSINGTVVSNIQNFNYTFSSNGIYEVCLKVYDNNGLENCSDTICKQVKVTSCNISSDCEIEADFNYTLISRSSCTHNFTDESSSSSGTDLTAWQWSVNGTTVSNAQNFNYTFPSNDTYEVCLITYGDNDFGECKDRICKQVEVTSCNTLCDLVSIPDPIFEQILVQYHIDTDGEVNGTMCREDALPYTELPAALDPNISDFTGLEAFVNLEAFRIRSFFNLTSIDLSQNTKLRNLSISGHFIDFLDLSQNADLENLVIDGSYELNSLILAPNSDNLTTIYADRSDNLSDIDLSRAPNLERFWCFECDFSSIDISNNPNLESLGLQYNNLTSLDLSNNSALISLSCSNNNLTSLDVSNNISLQSIYAYKNNLTSLDISNNVSLETLYVYENNLESLNLKNNANATLNEMRAFDNDNLECIQVDNVIAANNRITWFKDGTASYAISCPLEAAPPGPITLLSCNPLLNGYKLSWGWIGGPSIDGYELEVRFGDGSSAFYNLFALQNSYIVDSSQSIFWRVRPTIDGEGVWSRWVTDCSFPILRSTSSLSQSFDNNGSTETLKIWPNPSDGTYYLDIGSEYFDLENVEVYDIVGKKLLIETGVENGYVFIKLDPSYESGVYFLTFKNGDKLISSRLIKK